MTFDYVVFTIGLCTGVLMMMVLFVGLCVIAPPAPPMKGRKPGVKYPPLYDWADEEGEVGRAW